MSCNDVLLVNGSFAPQDNLLRVCAVLRWFDAALLQAVSAPLDHELDAFLSSDLVIVLPEAHGRVSLREAIRADVLAHLRAEQPKLELDLHTRVFEYFVRSMADVWVGRHEYDVESDCFYHLECLFGLLTPRGEWRTLLKLVHMARAARPRQQEHLHRLALYEGYAAIRLHDYDHGEAILSRLLEAPELMPAIRIHALNALGASQHFQAHYDQAIAWYQQLYTVANATNAPVYQGVALVNMSHSYNDLGYYERAMELSEQSLELFRALGDQYREADALTAVGNNAMRLGRWHDAKSSFDAAIQLYKALGIVSRLANTYCNQGFLQHMLGDERASLESFLQALQVAGGEDHAELAVELDTYAQLGFLYQTMGESEAAAQAYEQALELAELVRNQLWPSLIHYQRGNLFKRQGDIHSTKQAYEQAIAAIEMLRDSTEGEDLKIGLLGTTQQVYEAMVLLCLELDDPAAAFHYGERARSRAFLDTLARKAPDLYNTFDQPVVTLADVQRSLPANAVLLEYFTIGVVPRGEHLINRLPHENVQLRQQLTLPPEVILFAITHEQMEVHRLVLDPNTLRPMQGDPGSGRRLLYGRMLPSLHERLIKPVQHLLERCDLLYLVPHGPLHYVPFQALHSAAGDYLLAADGPMLALAPSSTILVRNCLNRPTSTAIGALALGYNDEGKAALLSAEAEARSVARLMKGVAWTGAAPKSAQLQAASQGVRWLHFAGHAVYKPRDPLESVLRLGQGDELSARRIMSDFQLQAELVTLSACTSGLSQVVPGDELLGLQRAFLYAGATTVVCTLWEATDLVTRLVMERFYTDLQQGRLPATALRDAQVFVRQLTGREAGAIVKHWQTESPEDAEVLEEIAQLLLQQPHTQPFAEPFYWAPFMLIGRP